MKTLLERLGVCSWSLQPSSAKNLFADLLRLGVRRVQIDLDAIRADPAAWADLPALCATHGVHLSSGMFRTVGEDYSSLQRIRETGGLLPEQTWEDSWEVAQESAELAKRLGIAAVSFHAGFVPFDEAAPDYERLLHRVRLVADCFAAHHIDLALETGQETALTLKKFLHRLGRANAGVNFDPANMLIYDMGDPVEALEILSPWLKQIHIKDGVRPPHSGVLGQEAVLGTGQVEWRGFFAGLQSIEFTGQLFIEREDGEHRWEDIRWARQYVERIQTRENAAIER